MDKCKSLVLRSFSFLQPPSPSQLFAITVMLIWYRPRVYGAPPPKRTLGIVEIWKKRKRLCRLNHPQHTAKANGRVGDRVPDRLGDGAAADDDGYYSLLCSICARGQLPSTAKLFICSEWSI